MNRQVQRAEQLESPSSITNNVPATENDPHDKSSSHMKC